MIVHIHVWNERLQCRSGKRELEGVVCGGIGTYESEEGMRGMGRCGGGRGEGVGRGSEKWSA